jgi:gluconolactonase
LIKDLAQPNGLAFSPDGRKLYVDDSERKDIHVYDVARDGSVSNGHLFAKMDGPGDPDGMRVDMNGNLYVTGQSGIWVFDAAANHLGTIVLPEQTANLTWGDPDYGTLYITSSTSVLKLRTKGTGFVPYR